MGRFRSLLERIVLPVLRRRQYESIILRAYFSRTYGINVGMYSVYCFDRWRIAAGTTIGRYCSIAATARRHRRQSSHPSAFNARLSLLA